MPEPEIDHQAGMPVWRQLYDILAARISSGDIPVGRLLPSVRDLMQRYEISDGTAKRALGQLRREGIVRTQQGRGIYVVKKPGEPGTEDRPPAG